MNSRKSRLWADEERERHGKKMAELREGGVTLEGIANQYGISIHTVQNTLRFYIRRSTKTKKEADKIIKKVMVRREQ